ncbi:MAG: T9SS type A sorting domain-containing protein [Bacteroidia bacterium]|nr:T9SS type A sorting domain-containing protein [Bacteroidia bacterium]
MPSNFEFLDHRVKNTYPGVFVQFEDEILYVSSNSSWPMTSVSLVNSSNQVNSVFSSFFSARSKKITHSDSSYTIYLYELFDYDIWMPGFYVIDYNSGEIQIDSVLTYEQNNVDFNNVCFDVARDSTDQYYAVNWDKLLRITDGEVTEEYDFEIAYGSRLFKNANSDIYLFRDNELYYFNGNNLIPVKSFQEDILDIRKNGTQNILLFEGLLMIYDLRFDELLHEILIDPEIFSLDQVHVQDTTINTIIPLEDTLTYIQHDLVGNETVLINELMPDEWYRSFKLMNENEILVCGFYRDNNISSNLFFRSVPLDSIVNYKKSSLSIQEFKLHQSRRDTFHSFTDIHGDTIYEIRFFYDIDITLQNESDNIVKYFNIFSHIPNASPFGNSSFSYTSSDVIAPNESLSVQSGYTKYFGSISGFEIVIPGANYRFNDNENRIAFPEFTSTVVEEDFDPDIVLYPNPTVDRLTIESPHIVKNVAIYNQEGQLVLFHQSSDLRNIDVQFLPSASYFVKLSFDDPDKVVWKKILKF